jgi:hypothetical protein
MNFLNSIISRPEDEVEACCAPSSQPYNFYENSQKNFQNQNNQFFINAASIEAADAVSQREASLEELSQKLLSFIEQNPLNFFWEVSNSAIIPIVFPSIPAKFCTFNDFSNHSLLQKLTVLTVSQLLIDRNVCHSNLTFPQLLTHPIHELLKRVLSMDGLLQILSHFNFSEEQFNSIICGFDLTVGYLFLVNDDLFIYCDVKGEYRV